MLFVGVMTSFDDTRFLKVLSNNVSLAQLLVSLLERTFPTCSSPNLPVDFSTGEQMSFPLKYYK